MFTRYFQLKFIFVLLVLFCSKISFSQVSVQESFRFSTSNNVSFGGDAGLTAANNIDIEGDGWLRLTNDETGRSGYAFIDQAFNSTSGVLIEFDYKMWRDRAGSYGGGDGFSVFLYDGATSAAQFRIGASGGALGYAWDYPNTPGVRNGYLGIGFDAFGNFSKIDAPNKFSGLTSGFPYPSSIVARGRIYENGPDVALSNTYLKGTVLTGTAVNPIATDLPITYTAQFPYGGNQNLIQYDTPTTNRPTDAQFYRRVQIEITPIVPAQEYEVVVRWRSNYNAAGFVELMRYRTTQVPPSTLKVGFVASTGGAFNNHEIRNLIVSSVGNLSVYKNVDKYQIRNNVVNTLTYRIDVRNDSERNLNDISFSDILTDENNVIIPNSQARIIGLTTQFFSSVTGLPTLVSANNPVSINQLQGTLGLPAKSSGVILITVQTTTSLSPGDYIHNNVNVFSPSADDEDLTNNNSSIFTLITGEGHEVLATLATNDKCFSNLGSVYNLNLVNVGTTAVQLGGKDISVLTQSQNPRYFNYFVPKILVVIKYRTGGIYTPITIPTNWSLIANTGDPSAFAETGYTMVAYTYSFPTNYNNETSVNPTLIRLTGFSIANFSFRVTDTKLNDVKVEISYYQEKGVVQRRGSNSNNYSYSTLSSYDGQSYPQKPLLDTYLTNNRSQIFINDCRTLTNPVLINRARN